MLFAHLCCYFMSTWTCISVSDFLQIRVKHMISQGVVEQTPFASGHSRANMTFSGRSLETNTDNLLRMVESKYFAVKPASINMPLKFYYWNCFQVSYCENDVDCRRLLQLIHFGEKFDSLNCQKTCDNCSKNQSYVDKDVTEIAKQLVRVSEFDLIY